MPDNTALAELISDVRERLLFMQELGVEHLDTDLPRAVSIKPEFRQPEAYSPPEPLKLNSERGITEPSKPRRSILTDLPTLSSRRTEPVSVTEDMKKTSAAHAPAAEVASLFEDEPSKLPESGETLDSIRLEIGECQRCPLSGGRTQVVHSTGNPNAELMFVGEAPGADEDAQGFPFVGRAGQLLTKMIEGIGYKREDVFIGNINRCRPPGNRAPTIDEAHTCRPFLLREIAVVRPKVVVVMGNTALHNLLDTKEGITRVRGVFRDYFGVKVMPTFHPAYLLRDPNKKREACEDLKMVRDYLNEQK